MKELTTKVKGSEAPKYKIEKYKDTYVINNFETFKERVKIKHLYFPRELREMFEATYPNFKDDLTQIDLSNDIFRTSERRVRNEANGGYKTVGNNPISSTEFNRKIKAVAKELYPDERMKTHSLRKYFATQNGYVNLSDFAKKNLNLEIGSEVEFNFKEHLMGHETHYSSKVYSKILSNRNIYFQLWKQLEKNLVIDMLIIETTEEDVEELKEQIAKLQEEKADILKKNEQLTLEVKDLKANFSIIENRVNKIEKSSAERGILNKEQRDLVLSVVNIDKNKELLETIKVLKNLDMNQIQKLLKLVNPLDKLNSK